MHPDLANSKGKSQLHTPERVEVAVLRLISADTKRAKRVPILSSRDPTVPLRVAGSVEGRRR